MIDHQVRSWCEILFGPGDQFEALFLPAHAANGPDRRPWRGWRRWPDDMGWLESACGRAEEAGYDCYASVVPKSLQQTGRVDRLWVDQDDPSGSALWTLVGWPDPSLWVQTSATDEGFRWQAVWMLDRKIPHSLARRLMRKMAKRIGADTTVHDIRRVLRLPGLTHQKRGGRAKLMGTIPSQRVSPDAFGITANEEPTLGEMLQEQVLSPRHILGEWLGGVPEGGRATKAFLTARFLSSCQVSAFDASQLLKLGASRCSPPFNEKETMRALRSAYLNEGGRQ